MTPQRRAALTVTINGRPADVEPTATVAQAVEQVVDATQARGVAVARNGELVPRSAWSSTALHDGDAVEVVTASQGG